MNKTYLVYQISDGLCVNAIFWDGVTEYNPGEGLAFEIQPAGGAGWIGWTRVSEGNWTEPIIKEQE